MAIVNVKEIKGQDPRLYTEARVRRPSLVPCFLWSLYRPHVGKQGIILGVERGRYSKKLYTLLFERAGLYWMYSYFEEELEFL